MFFFFFSSRRRHTRFDCDWSSDVCSSDLPRCSRAARWRAPWSARHRRANDERGRPGGSPMKLYDLSQPLNERSSFWPYYPPFEVKYIKRKAEHGVNAQYIMTSNHMGTHLD